MDNLKNITKLFAYFLYTKDINVAFADWCHLLALELSVAEIYENNKLSVWNKKYQDIISKYDVKEQKIFTDISKLVVDELEINPKQDLMGRIYSSELELYKAQKGQFFTPYLISELMAKMTITPEKNQDRDFVRLLEPACGAGGMAIAAAHEFRRYGVKHHLTCIDIDISCVHMCFVQLALLGIPAVVIHGDTLAVKNYSYWRTPTHTIEGWDRKLGIQIEEDFLIERIRPEIQPISIHQS